MKHLTSKMDRCYIQTSGTTNVKLCKGFHEVLPFRSKLTKLIAQFIKLRRKSKPFVWSENFTRTLISIVFFF